MKAMIFAAGLGTRLYPITKNKPKALAPFGNTTLLAYNLHFLHRNGISKFIINTHHFADKIDEYLKQNNNFGLDIEISYEANLLDTAGGLAHARRFFETENDILLFNVDVITTIDIQQMYRYHIKHKASATLAVRNRISSRYLLFDNNNVLVGWRNTQTGEEKWCNNSVPKAKEMAFSGIHWINRSIFNTLNEEKLSLVPHYLAIAKTQQIIAYEHNSSLWFDCGSIEKLQTAEKAIINK